MEAIIHILSGLIMHANPLGFETRLTYDQFMGLAQFGVFMILVGVAMIGLARCGFPERQATILGVILVLLSSFYLMSHGGNPFDFAEKACGTAGGLFRFVGGVGVAIGAVCLLGMGRHSWGESRADLFNPVVMAASAIYGLFSLDFFNTGSFLDTRIQIMMVLSIVAAWLSFGGLHSILRARIGCYCGQRQLSVVTGGVMLLILMSFVAAPGQLSTELWYSVSFPAGVVIGLFWKVAM